MEPDFTTAFDALHTNNYIQKLKVLHAFASPDIQHFMAIYIKYLEFQYTLSNHITYQPFSGSMNTIAEAMRPFCSPSEQQQLKQLEQFMDSFETAKVLSETMDMMKELFPAEELEKSDSTKEPSESAFTNNPMMEQLLMGMLSEDQKSLFESLLDNMK